MFNQALKYCVLVLVHAHIFFEVPSALLSVVTGVLQFGLRFIGLVVGVIGAKIMVLEGMVGQPTVAGALCRADIGPALVGTGESGDFLPDGDIVNGEEGIVAVRGSGDQLIDLTRPSGRGHRVSGD